MDLDPLHTKMISGFGRGYRVVRKCLLIVSVFLLLTDGYFALLTSMRTQRSS